ncbi:origin recognition complex subunit 1 [Pancytospora epiphaga]|nr:origin recognition complex subunit 1 [Pancytospora epiphaga]
MPRSSSIRMPKSYEAKKPRAQRKGLPNTQAIKMEEDNTTKVKLRRNIVISNPLCIKRVSTTISDGASTSTVLRREKEYETIKERVEAFNAYGASAIIYIAGVPGSGKTYTVEKVFKILGISNVYVNCSSLSSKQKIFSMIGQTLSCCEATSLQSLRAHFHVCEERHIIVVDEVDFLRTKNELILYNLFELPFVDKAQVLLIVISNTLGSLSSKTESRIGKERVEFKPYSSADLQDILSKQIITDLKADETVKGSSVKICKPTPDPKSLELIAKRVASSTGDIRKAIDLVSIVGSAGVDAVDAIIKDTTMPLLSKFIYSLGYYQKLVLFMNYDSSKNLLEWFNSFKTFCKLKRILEIDFICFRDVVESLVSFGMFKMIGVRITSQYYKEEFERVIQKDKVFKTFM